MVALAHRTYVRGMSRSSLACACALVVLALPASAQASLGYVSTFGSAGTGNGQFSSDPSAPAPSRLAVGSNLYVTDPGNDRVQTFSTSGAFIDAFGSSGSYVFGHPAGVAFDSTHGYIYVSDLGTHAITEWDAASSPPAYIGSFGAANLTDPIGISVSSDGHKVFVADPIQHQIVEFDDFTFSQNIAPTDPGLTNFRPTDVVYDGTNLWAVEPQNNRVEKISTSGTTVATGDPAIGFTGPQGLAYVPSINGVLVTDTNRNRVVELDASGNLFDEISALGAGGTFNKPVGIASSGVTSWVADRDNHRVVRLTSDFHAGVAPDTT